MIKYLQKEGTYKGKKFNAICHFFGYQARGSLPSKFDCDYAYVSSFSLANQFKYPTVHNNCRLPKLGTIMLQVLGHISYHILAAGLNGYMATVTNLKNPSNKWRCGAAPITVEFPSLHFL